MLCYFYSVLEEYHFMQKKYHLCWQLDHHIIKAFNTGFPFDLCTRLIEKVFRKIDIALSSDEDKEFIVNEVLSNISKITISNRDGASDEDIICEYIKNVSIKLMESPWMLTFIVNSVDVPSISQHYLKRVELLLSYFEELMILQSGLFQISELPLYVNFETIKRCRLSIKYFLNNIIIKLGSVIPDKIFDLISRAELKTTLVKEDLEEIFFNFLLEIFSKVNLSLQKSSRNGIILQNVTKRLMELAQFNKGLIFTSECINHISESRRPTYMEIDFKHPISLFIDISKC